MSFVNILALSQFRMISALRKCIYIISQGMNMYLFFAAFSLDQLLCYIIKELL